LKKLIESTTIVKVYDNSQRRLIFGDENLVSRFNVPANTQCDLTLNEEAWKKKWLSFNGAWSKERQLYRFFYDSFRLFYYSFDQLVKNKIRSINHSEVQEKMLYYDAVCGTSLYGIYHHGKKCIDL